MADYQQGPDFQFILRVLNTNVDGRESEFGALLLAVEARGGLRTLEEGFEPVQSVWVAHMPSGVLLALAQAGY